MGEGLGGCRGVVCWVEGRGVEGGVWCVEGSGYIDMGEGLGGCYSVCFGILRRC